MFIAARHDEQYGAEPKLTSTDDLTPASHTKEGRSAADIA